MAIVREYSDISRSSSHGERQAGDPASSRSGRLVPRLVLAATCCAAALVWTVLLPRVGNQPGIRSSIDRREALGINAEAMFYTELEAMETLAVEWE